MPTGLLGSTIAPPPPRSQELTLALRLGPFQGQHPGDNSQNLWGSSQSSGRQRKQPSTKLPGPGPSLGGAEAHRDRPTPRATPTQTSAAFKCSPFQTSPNPALRATRWGAAANLSPAPQLPPVELITSPLRHTLPPGTSAGIRVVLVAVAPCGQQETLRARQLSAFCPPLNGWRGFNGGEVSGVAPPHQALGHPGWGANQGVGFPQRPAWPPFPPRPQLGPQQCFLVVQEPGPSVASSSFRKPNCSFIF